MATRDFKFPIKEQKVLKWVEKHESNLESGLDREISNNTTTTTTILKGYCANLSCSLGSKSRDSTHYTTRD